MDGLALSYKRSSTRSRHVTRRIRRFRLQQLSNWQRRSHLRMEENTDQQEKICEFLNKTSKIRIIGEDTDLTFNVAGRKWINSDEKRNMPSGEVFTAPVENSANGTIRFTFPGIFSRREVEDITLTFKDGKVLKASATKGDALLQQISKIEDANRIGETAIGTNYGITKFIKTMTLQERKN